MFEGDTLMNFLFEHHLSPKVLHIGCSAPRAYYIPYQNESSAMSDIREKSDRFISLCGDWNFRYYPSLHLVEDFTSEDFSSESFDKLTVPMSWQTMYERGYDKPNYKNIDYPFPIIPPHVPRENPCGLYVRSFNVTKEMIKVICSSKEI